MLSGDDQAQNGLADAAPGLFETAGKIGAASGQAAAAPHFHNHRARLRSRFLEAGSQALADYEMLELVLFRAIPRRDVKPLAKRLLAQFGDFNGVISAPVPRLAEIQGIGDAVICELKIVEAAAHRLARARVLNRPVLSSWSALMDYCKTAMAHRDTEQVRVLFLDRKNVLVADEAQGTGTVDHVPVYPREVVKRGLELNASALILVHNHPSGDPTPSQADVEMTRRIEAAAKSVGIVIHDHVVIGKARDASFRALGLL
ncbi:MAG: DNA repair protein RadC [Pikeienuella sp.]